MEEFPFAYERIAATTWAYMSSLMMIALFFKFNRFWSVRNFDLLLIILLAPGLLLVAGGRNWQAEKALAFDSAAANPLEDSQEPRGPLADSANPNPNQLSRLSAEGQPAIDSTPDLKSLGASLQRAGYYWLFGVGAIFLLRMLLDPSFVRKPLLDPNLSSGGLVFLGMSLMVFLFANIIMSEPTPNDLRGARDSLKLMQRQAADEGDVRQLNRQGPGYWLFNLFPVISTFNSGDEILETNPDEAAQLTRYVIAAKSLAIASQVLIVLGLVFFCRYHYGNFNVGVGVATIYLMLPYTAIFTGHVLHSLPAALLIWALVCFRRPWLAGILVGMSTGVSYYPLFLLPLWCSFYWQRGVRSFLIGVAISLSICILGLAFTSPDMAFFVHQLRSMFGFLLPRLEGLEGLWALGWNQWYRLPLLVAHVILSVSFIFWPVEKNIGTLISYTAALMVAVQFWLGFDGALTMAWYLPLALLVFFRPNLNGRVAESELNVGARRGRTESTANLIV